MIPSLLAALALGQASPTCRRVLDHQVCGYHCRTDSAGNVACSSTEEGACTADTGRAFCWDPTPLLLAVWPEPLPAAECLVRYSRVACGYHCASDLGAIACAQTPLGVCRALYGQVTCWDPSLALLYFSHGNLAPPQCLEGHGRVGCGYDCKVGLRGVHCAQTPQGFCHRELAGVECWDPELPPLPPLSP
ncbi:MAG: hypothetical protein ACYDCL_13890 [Myxococcales bacterium]